MSTIAPVPRLGWRLLPAVLTAAATAIAAGIVIGALRDRPAAVIGRLDPPVAAAVASAPWKIDVFPVGNDRPLRRSDRQRLRIQKARVGHVAGELADLMTLEPHRVPTDARALLTKPAAKAIRRALSALPEGATNVAATKRVGEIGVQSPRFNAAAARMEIKMRAHVDQRTVRWTQHMTLWLERNEKAWRVLAFDIKRSRGR